MSQCQKMKKLHWLHQLMTCHYHSPPYSIVTVRVQTSKLTKRSPRGISSSPIETSSPRCHRPSMTAKKQILAKSPGRLSSSPIETSLPPRGHKPSATPQKQIQSAGIGVLWRRTEGYKGCQRIGQAQNRRLKGTCKLNAEQYSNYHFFKIDINTSSTTWCILLIIRLFIFN